MALLREWVLEQEQEPVLLTEWGLEQELGALQELVLARERVESQADFAQEPQERKAAETAAEKSAEPRAPAKQTLARQAQEKAERNS